MNLLSLDLDVVHVILSEIKPTDAFRLALTCRAAHDVAYPRFLSEVVLGHPWRRTGPDRLVQFCTAMLADASLRILHLRELIIHKTAFQPTRSTSTHSVLDSAAMAFLAEVLKYAVNLRSICIHDTEELLETMPEFRWPLASLPNLQDVRFLHAGTRALDVLVSFGSQPRRLEIDFSGLPTDMDAPPPYKHEVLQNLMRNLVSMKLSRVAGMTLAIPAEHVWPKVEQFEIFGDLQSLQTFASVFPNLRRLSLVSSYVEDGLHPVSWPYLDHVSTSCPIPLDGPVRRMELMYDLDVLLDSMPYSVWAPGTMSLLQKTMPVVLACSPNMQILRWIANIVKSVRVLQVYVFQPIHPDNAGIEDVDTWLKCYVPILSAVPLVAFTIARGLSKAVPAAELSRLASFAAAQIPTLKYVGFNLTAAWKSQSEWSNCEYSWYRVMRTEAADASTNPAVVALSDLEGSVVHHRLVETERTCS
ncbi:uncharacterized protein C8Q71DRAFT_787530 [Rhodofomes roseus]|uniref:F-box domain-containing protein n=1 Tax=Rhodofomes roseus TaxID=34475 RepID=A0A4Y9XL08_9APHY|nr:uncharacterized protein C8Q71DRAFT_787530 [Rhodofomes roseus]KAH9830145.1 hypothetical protein C8Q71DRAFT_787530 [Rhodofomes roseus]TFY50944.1 hypothetical protein EVJ58_g10820 [Rhodofomes roseus]